MRLFDRITGMFIGRNNSSQFISDGSQSVPEGYQSSDHGRTFYDLIYSTRFIVLIGIVLIGVLAASFLGLVSFDFIKEWMNEVGYFCIVAFIVGFYFADWIVDRLYIPRFRLILTISDNDVVSLKAIPETVFKYFTQAGNNYILMSVNGNPVYLAHSVDLETGVIDYGWAHLDKWELVAVRKKMFKEWKLKFVELLLRNMELEGFTKGKSLVAARGVLERTFDQIEKMFGIVENQVDIVEPVAENITAFSEAESEVPVS